MIIAAHFHSSIWWFFLSLQDLPKNTTSFYFTNESQICSLHFFTYLCSILFVFPLPGISIYKTKNLFLNQSITQDKVHFLAHNAKRLHLKSPHII